MGGREGGVAGEGAVAVVGVLFFNLGLKDLQSFFLSFFSYEGR